MDTKDDSLKDRNLMSMYTIYAVGKIMIVRVVVLWLSISILWSISIGQAFFTSLFIMMINQVLFAFCIQAINEIRKVFAYSILLVNASVLLLATLGLMGVAKIVETDLGFYISFVRGVSVYHFISSDTLVLFLTFYLTFSYIIEWATGADVSPRKLEVNKK